ncbi:hypothetical protein [Streptomyces sp. NPDC017958]|uniref:hypothetical protein n=1 Tax=Streptomyces sp. NPDC017958 TaxID=3365021 RepID=UPI003791D493
MTFYEWRTQLRIYHALLLLADGHDTTRTADACGCANPSSFISAFTDIRSCHQARLGMPWMLCSRWRARKARVHWACWAFYERANDVITT